MGVRIGKYRFCFQVCFFKATKLLENMGFTKKGITQRTPLHYNTKKQTQIAQIYTNESVLICAICV